MTASTISWTFIFLLQYKLSRTNTILLNSVTDWIIKLTFNNIVLAQFNLLRIIWAVCVFYRRVAALRDYFYIQYTLADLFFIFLYLFWLSTLLLDYVQRWMSLLCPLQPMQFVEDENAPPLPPNPFSELLEQETHDQRGEDNGTKGKLYPVKWCASPVPGHRILGTDHS